MLIINTTFQTDLNDARDFVVWLHEKYIPTTVEQGDLKNPRLTRILSHREQDSECFSLQFEVESTLKLHHWHVQVGQQLEQEMIKMFNERVVGFSTMMEIIE
ncbi:MAG: DUF4286 family protein [Bacteroidaceae bacterium]|nr:DUF4286 family protein [Bacteroidaceae bacterium]MDO4956591.1 DUF4286 family protein [Bacteroidales bacterium]